MRVRPSLTRSRIAKALSTRWRTRWRVCWARWPAKAIGAAKARRSGHSVVERIVAGRVTSQPRESRGALALVRRLRGSMHPSVVAVNPFPPLVPFLRFNGKCCDWTRIEPPQIDWLARLLAIAVGTLI